MAASRQPTSSDITTYEIVRSSFKKIEDYTDAELNAVIKVIPTKHPFAYEILNFVDCYLERRKRQQLATAHK